MIWYFEDYRRHRQEREALDALASSADWLIPVGWRVDGELHLIWDADIIAPADVRPVSLRYPNHFPHSPPLVLPRGVTERWSGHQYGAGGELCLEYGPDNWRSELTGADMVSSAYRLLTGEQPSPGQSGEVASRHATTTGQNLRAEHTRFLVTRALAEFFGQMPDSTPVTAKAIGLFHERAFVNVISSIAMGEGEPWRDTLPPPLRHEWEREVALCKLPSSAAWPSMLNLVDFRAGLSGHGFELGNNRYVVVIRDSRIRAYSLNDEANNVRELAVIPPESEASRLDDGHQALQGHKVAVVGCGSLGSKIAVMLARAGVGNFLLVDDDLLLPDNFVRHDLDWRDVGTHKADSVAERIQLVNTAATCNVRKHRLGGQESSGSVESLIESLSGYDLLVDATAEPAVFNYLSAAAAVGKKPLLWAEIFGGGFGGLIARHRPGIEPSPQSMRGIIENWCADHGQPIARPAKRYDGGPELPSIADDADVSVIAAHTARMAIDLLIPRDPSSFPNSVYLIGLSKGWLFSQPFETYPIDVGPPEPPPAADVADPTLATEEAEKIFKLFVEYKNATSPSEPADPAPAE
jgi:sulfur-carrier protein adenylyltransferase/sulfurtransferase